MPWDGALTVGIARAADEALVADELDAVAVEAHRQRLGANAAAARDAVCARREQLVQFSRLRAERANDLFGGVGAEALAPQLVDEGRVSYRARASRGEHRVHLALAALALAAARARRARVRLLLDGGEAPALEGERARLGGEAMLTR